MKNRQTWVLEVVEKLVEEGVIGDEIAEVVKGAPKN